MSFITWMKMNLLMDCSFIVFAIAMTWKVRKIQKEMRSLKNLLSLSIRNPNKARKTLINEINEVK